MAAAENFWLKMLPTQAGSAGLGSRLYPKGYRIFVQKVLKYILSRMFL
jgi:hypothetical protein